MIYVDMFVYSIVPFPLSLFLSILPSTSLPLYPFLVLLPISLPPWILGGKNSKVLPSVMHVVRKVMVRPVEQRCRAWHRLAQRGTNWERRAYLVHYDGWTRSTGKERSFCNSITNRREQNLSITQSTKQRPTKSLYNSNY